MRALQADSQASRILGHLAHGRAITPLQALDKFGCLRLSGRILELRQRGHRIDSELVEVAGKTVARYVLR